MAIYKEPVRGDHTFYRDEVDQLIALRTAELSKLNDDLSREVAHWQAAERESRKHEQDVRQIFDESPVPLVLVRFSDSKILHVNHRASSLLRLDRSQALRRTTQDFWPNSEQRQAFIQRLRRDGRVDAFLTQMKPASGQSLWVELSAQCLRYEGGDCYMLSFCDVSAQKLAQDTVRDATLGIRTLFAAAPVPLLLSTLEDDRVLIANTRALDLFEVSSEHLLAKRANEYFITEHAFEGLVRQTQAVHALEGYEAEMRTQSGRKFWATISARILDFEGERALMLGILDITSHRILEDKLRELATRDPLTLAFNRRHFLEICGTEIERSRRHAQPLSICMLDADHFKLINDEYGHSVGDQVLQELCRACREDLRSSDVLSRVGGEEFVVLFPNTARHGAEKVAERIRSHIAARQLFTHDGRTVRFTVSGGVCELTSADDLQNLLRRADDAMYAAKRAGRNRIAAG